jgi:hyaluronoglucosaminidase
VAVSYPIGVPRSFRLRGIVEGFYGRPWSHEARLDVLSFVAERGMNAYLYAPKDDPKHRAAWRDPYDDVQMAQFRALADHAKAIGIRFGFAISPGLDIDYASNADRAALLEKLGPFVDAGVNWFLLALDDIPAAADLAPRQADIAGWLFDALRKERDDTAMVLCPTEYIGTHPSPYLTDLGRLLPTEIDVMWTGPTVCSPVITADAAAGWRAALGGRPPLVWDNYPVNDGSMESSLHLGPYRGREAALADTTIGVLCNPMRHAYASKVALATAADFLRDPDAYDPTISWRRAIDDVGGVRRAPLRVLAEACADSPLCEPSELDIARRVDELRDEIGGPGWVESVRNAVEVLRAAKRVRDDFPADDDDELVREVAQWAAAAAVEADTGLAALRLIQQLRPVATIVGEDGRLAGVDAEAAMHTAFLVMYAWSGARRNAQVAFGPRFALYPAVVQLADGKPGVDVRAAVREDCNAIDALCRLALEDYDAWCTAPTNRVRVFVDGEARTVDAEGRFDARGDMVLVRDERTTTRVGTADRLPFRDARLS